MGADARLNLLLTPPPPAAGGAQPWHQTLTHLLLPLGVRTFEATSGQQAVDLIEKHTIHLAVVDTRLPSISGLNVLQLIQKLRDQVMPTPGAPARSDSPVPPAQSPKTDDAGPGQTGFHFKMEVEQSGPQGPMQRRIEVRFDPRPAQPKGGPVVILIAPPPPQQDPQLLREALKFNAFTVLSEPVDVNLALDCLARAMKRFHQNQWPV